MRPPPISIHKPHAVSYEKGREYNALYQINSLGLRDREYGPKAPDSFRVLLLGDSFCVSHGLPIEESLSRQLERGLQEIIAKKEMDLSVEVINGAAGGYSPYNYWKAYQRWEPILKPDVVVVGLSPDDYDSSNAALNYAIEDGVTMAVFREGQEPKKVRKIFIRSARKWLSQKSEFYVLLRNYLYYNDLVGRISLWLTKKDIAKDNQLKQFLIPKPAEITDSWIQSFSFLKKLHEDASVENTQLVLFSIPLKIEVISEEYQRAIAASSLKEEEVDIHQPLEKIIAFSKKRGIPLIDLRPALKSCNNEVPCYFLYDGHWNAEGVRSAADYISKKWLENESPPFRILGRIGKNNIHRSK